MQNEVIINKEIRHYKRDIIFTKRPLLGVFRYQDIFQIFPAVLKGMPETKTAQKHYPIILEYWYTEEELKEVNSQGAIDGLEDLHQLAALSYNKRNLFISLLTLITTSQFFYYTADSGQWGYPVLDENANEETINSWSTKWCLPWFHWPELVEQLKITEFSKPLIKDQHSIPWSWYYIFPKFDESFNDEIFFPSLAGTFLDSYFNTDPENKAALDSAINSSNVSLEFMHSRKKLSLLSAFTAIETMVNLDSRDYKPTKCEKCNQDQYKISARYRDFLMKYIGHSENNKKKFNRYYSLRSKIVHTGQELYTEKLFADIDDSLKYKERLEVAEIIILSKLSVIFWAIREKTNSKKIDLN